MREMVVGSSYWKIRFTQDGSKVTSTILESERGNASAEITSTYSSEAAASQAFEYLCLLCILVNMAHGVPWRDAKGEWPDGPEVDVWWVSFDGGCQVLAASVDEVESIIRRTVEGHVDGPPFGTERGRAAFLNLVRALERHESAQYGEWLVVRDWMFHGEYQARTVSSTLDRSLMQELGIPHGSDARTVLDREPSCSVDPSECTLGIACEECVRLPCL